MTYSFAKSTRKTLYTPEQRIRRDATKWTLVQGILAPLQFLVFAISLLLVLRFLATGHGYDVATLSILIKSLLLFTIMVTGAIWEKVVFGQYLFAPAFFWEDVFSFAVIALHGLYLWALWSQALAATELMLLALAAYTAYVINAGQFLWKLRRARLDLAPEAPGLLAASLGLSRMYADDLEQLDAGMGLYDAFYRWCRDATEETHNWPSNKVKP